MAQLLALTQTAALAAAVLAGAAAGAMAQQVTVRPGLEAGPPTVPITASGWEMIAPGGDCACADGSEFHFWVRPGDPSRVVFFLEGGGVCLSTETCAFTGEGGENDYYDYNLATERPGLGDGIYEFDNPDNPFAGYTFVYVPLCTGDAYLGNVVRQYAADLTVRHIGFRNGSAALDYVAETFRDAVQVAVVGKTAGSIAAPVYGGLASDLFPDADIVVLGAQSGGLPADPEFNTMVFGELWGAYAAMPEWEVNAGLSPGAWGGRGFWIQAGLHDPDITMARFDHAYDQNAGRMISALFGLDPASLLSLIDANEAAIEAAGVKQHSYTAPGNSHGIFEFDTFYELEVEGVRFVDWLRALLSGGEPEDVHCVDCGNPAGPTLNPRPPVP